MMVWRVSSVTTVWFQFQCWLKQLQLKRVLQKAKTSDFITWVYFENPVPEGGRPVWHQHQEGGLWDSVLGGSDQGRQGLHLRTRSGRVPLLSGLLRLFRSQMWYTVYSYFFASSCRPSDRFAGRPSPEPQPAPAGPGAVRDPHPGRGGGSRTHAGPLLHRRRLRLGEQLWGTGTSSPGGSRLHFCHSIIEYQVSSRQRCCTDTSVFLCTENVLNNDPKAEVL